MRARNLLAVAVTLIAASLASAGPVSLTDRLPINPYAQARVGDWAVYRCTFVHRWRSTRSSSTCNTYCDHEVGTVSKDRAYIVGEGGGREYDMKLAPTYQDLLDPFKQSKPTIESVENVDRVLGKRKIPCVKITFTTTTPKGRERETRWISDAVRALGIVAWSSDRIEGDETNHSEGQLVGFGNGKRAEWGKTVAQVRHDMGFDR
jgi:hypothetical protein